MLERVLVYIIAGCALALSARWVYRTVSGKSAGCGCADTSCPSTASCEPTDEVDCCEDS